MKKAAKEMKERIGKLSGNGVESQLVTGFTHSIFMLMKGHSTLFVVDISLNMER